MRLEEHHSPQPASQLESEPSRSHFSEMQKFYLIFILLSTAVTLISSKGCRPLGRMRASQPVHFALFLFSYSARSIRARAAAANLIWCIYISREIRQQQFRCRAPLFFCIIQKGRIIYLIVLPYIRGHAAARRTYTHIKVHGV
jgi:hypothetical protein